MSLRVIVEADGGSRGNPGVAGYGAVVRDAADGVLLAERKEYIGVATNNVAEYRGLIAGLTAAAELGADAVRVRMDSKLVVEQMSGRWQIKHPAMRPLAKQAAALAADFDEISFEWIARAENTHADRLANEAMDAGSGRRVQASRDRTDVVATEPTWIAPETTPTRLILVRHGVTEHSVARVFAGRSDLPLTQDGVRQANRAAARIAQLGPVQSVVSSPLRRARATAQAIAEQLGLAVEVSDGFIEADFGDWDGFSFAEVRQRWPAELTAWLADPSAAPPGGESFETVTSRVRRARGRVLAEHAGATIAVVSHVSPIKILIRLALDAPPSALNRMYIAPASISIIDYFSDGAVMLRSVNDSAHL